MSNATETQRQKLSIEIPNYDYAVDTVKDAIWAEIQKRQKMSEDQDWSDSWLKANTKRLEALYVVMGQLQL